MYMKISLPKFYARRALRIWPLFFTVLTATCFIYPLFAPYKASHLYGVFVRDLVVPLYTFTGNFALPWHFGAMTEYAKACGLPFMAFVTILTPFWSLCIEEQFYLLWGFSARVVNNLNRLMVFAGVLLFVGFLARFALLTWNREAIASTCYYMHSLWHLETIMMGALLAIVLIAKPDIAKPLRSGWLPPMLLAGLISTYLWVVTCGPSIHSWSYLLAPMMTLVSASGCLLLALALHWDPLKRVLSNRAMMHVGKLTFAMYVFHFFVCWWAKPTFNLQIGGWNGVWSLTVCFGITYLAALISWHVLEKPMNDMRRKLSRVHVEPEEKGVAAVRNQGPVKERESELVLK